MTILTSFLLGLVQGLTEFLPVSSSGHLVIFQKIFGHEGSDLILFDILLHVGTLVSVILVFRKDIAELIVQFFSLIHDLVRRKKNPIGANPYRRMIVMLLVSILPLFVIFPFHKSIEHAFDNVLLVGIALLITGTLLYMSDKLPKGTKDASNAKYRSALFVGIVQAIAVTPGISRSGSTIVAGEVTGFTRKFAAKFSFLMSIIAILGAAVSQVPKVINENIASTDVLPYCIGALTAAVSGIIAIKYMLKLINNGKLHYFAYYCWAVGVLAIIANFVF